MFLSLKKRAHVKRGASSGPPRQRWRGYLALAFLIGLLPQSLIAEQLSQPQLQSPVIESGIDAGTILKFDWSTVSNANTYRLQVSVTEDFATSADGKTCFDCVINEKTSLSEFTASQALESGSYFWRVRAGHTTDTNYSASDWSELSNFNVRLDTPVLSSLNDGKTLTDAKPEFNWSPISKADTYRIQVSSSSSISTSSDGKTCFNCVINEKPSQSQFQATNALNDGTYYWRVRAGDTTLHFPASKWSDVDSFTIETTTNPPDDPADNHAPTLEIVNAPSSVTVDETYAIQLRANDVDGNLHQIQVDATGQGGSDGNVKGKAASEGETVTFEHVYNSAASIVWTATAYDEDGAASNMVKQPITVVDPQASTEDKASFISETYPDYTSVTGGESFNKVWELKNIGTSTWNANYKLRFVTGKLSTNQSDVAVSGNVPPDGSFSFTVPMRAPQTQASTQIYREYWKLVSPSGKTINVWNSPIVLAIIKVPGYPKTKTGLSSAEQVAQKDETGTCQNVEYKGDPIDTSTGAQVLQHALLGAKGVVPISFNLFYNSLLLNTGKVGRAWSFTRYGARLEESSNGDVTVYWLDTQYNYFTKNASGQYESAYIACRLDTLVKNANGSFTLSRKNKTVYEFDSNGRLVTLSNHRGQLLNMSYDGDGRLNKVTEPVSGVFLEYAYNSQGLLTTVTDPLNRQVSLGYDSDKNLTTITDALGQTITYSYNALGQTLTAVNAEGVPLFSNTYDDQGRIATQDDSVSANQVFSFDYDETSEPGKVITTVTNRNGETEVYTYDDNYQLLKSQDALGQTVTYVYDANGKRTSSTDAKGNMTQLAYDSQGNLITITNAAGSATQLAYDDNSNLLSVTNALGKQSSLVYANNNLISTTDALDNITQYTYNSNGQILTTTSPSGAVTTYAYQNGLPISVTDAEGNTQTLGYDAAGRLVTVTDAEGHTTTLVYDGVNRLVSLKDALNHTASMTYDSRGQLLTLTDANGQVSHRSYDGNGNLISQINALEQETRYEYNGEDRLIKIIDANNHATQLSYDAKGRLVSVTDALGHTQQLSYDAADNLLKQIDALGNTVASFNYDVLNNVTQVTDALGQNSQFEYDVLSRLTRTIAPLNRSTQFSHDDLGRLVTSVDAAGKSSSQGFDKDANRTQLTDPNGNQTNFEFDKSGRLVKTTTAAGGSVQYSYSASDLLKTVINARGQARQFEYDAGGRLTSMTDADGKVTYAYDNNDNVLTVTDANGTISREYDALDRVIKYTDSQGNVLQYAYDAVGNLITLTYPDGKQVHYEYDVADRLVKVTDWANRITSYTYDANGRLTQVVRPNATQMIRDYDVAGQLLQQKDVDNEGELIRQFNFVYDAAGNITQEQSLPEAALVPIRSVVMTYEAANRADTYHSVTVEQEKDILLDADGNMTWGPLEHGSLKRNWVDFAYDSRNRLVSAGETLYRYDAGNQRITVSVSGEETRYVVNPQAVLSQVLVKTAPDGQQTFYVYGLGLIGQEAGGDYQAYHFDLRGSTVALSDAEGEVVERFHYSPYGDVISHHPRLIDVPFLYNGRDGVMTDDSGLLYMRARYYNTDLRRFVNQDPLLGGVAEGQTLNRYAYVNGRPVSYVDPFGLKKQLDFFTIHKLLKNYPTEKREAFITKIGRKSDETAMENTCTLRLSYALNESGETIPIDAKPELISIDRKKKVWLAFRTIEMKEYLDSYYGKPDIISSSKDIKNKKGIIYFDFEGDINHVDLWDGSKKCKKKCHWEEATEGIYFWEAKVTDDNVNTFYKMAVDRLSKPYPEKLLKKLIRKILRNYLKN